MSEPSEFDGSPTKWVEYDNTELASLPIATPQARGLRVVTGTGSLTLTGLDGVARALSSLPAGQLEVVQFDAIASGGAGITLLRVYF